MDTNNKVNGVYEPRPVDAGFRDTITDISHDRCGHHLKILNSLTRRKEPFVPRQTKIIKWYTCGPTVYDVAHLGHARCYITFDIIRRILADYFGYQIFYVMNITDIDDKIIKRARSNHLCDKFIEDKLHDRHQIVEHVHKALVDYQARRADEKDPAKLEMLNNIVKSSNEALEKLKQIESSDKGELRILLEQLRDVLADQLDNELAHTITDHQIFKALSLKFEQEYHEDMQRLDVLPPSALTRVSEYIDEIGAFIEKLESNGFAYRSNGSVYFDTHKFDSSPKHSYAKLVREAFGHKKTLDEGEGELSTAQQDTKKSPSDFALWKKSKPGEPSWTTGNYESGRPGWHIECSVMASHLLGENFDLHSGGCDLKFPHHDNEIAQAEAYYDSGKNWVNYFVHSGHLTISGCKMSKSLKNFITIRQALKDYTSRQLRFAFLAHGWAETLDYSPNAMNTAITFEKTFKEFFLNVTDALRRHFSKCSNDGPTKLIDHWRKWSESDQELNQEFLNTVDKLDIALCDNFDTRSALSLLCALIREYNKKPHSNLVLVRDIAAYIRRILGVFGANFDEIGSFDQFFSSDAAKNKVSIAGFPATSNDTTKILQHVDALAQFRSEVRRISKVGDAQQGFKQILSLCDALRDEILPTLGVRLEDKEVEGAPYVVKLVDAETIAKERAAAEKRNIEKQLKEETTKLEKLKLQQQRDERMKTSPNDMFRGQLDKYSQFDNQGMPTHDSNGKEISKSALKKLQRLYAEQEARYKKYIAEHH